MIPYCLAKLLESVFLLNLYVPLLDLLLPTKKN